MRMLLLAVCFPAIALAQDAGGSGRDGGSDLSRALNQAMGTLQSNQRTLARQQETLAAEGQRWRAARDAEKGAPTDKKYRALRATELSLTEKHGMLVKEYDALVARLEKLARDFADHKVDSKKAAAALEAITRDESRVRVEQSGAFDGHARLVGSDAAAADAGPADGGSLDAGVADTSPVVDAGSPDAGPAADAGARVEAVAGPGVTKPPPARACAAAGGGVGWLGVAALWWMRGRWWRRRRG